jgi:hypothetical protein
MISCQKCEFKILPKMRFALVKNFCPSCGGTLLSEADSQEVNGINKRLQSQEFMISLSNQLNKDLIQNLIYDLSIFIKFDLQKEQSRNSLELMTQDEINSSRSEEEEEEGRVKKNLRPISRTDSSGQSRSVKSRDIQSFKRALEGDEDLDEDSEDEDEEGESEIDPSEDDDERVKRLKKLYASSPTLKRFSGISRSE